jgi:predicted 3-demethylubiquinone-9 3-methyltransferase (glyoxalase superfamily)
MIAYCDDQAEIDRLWEALSVSGEKLQCGWLTDQFGMSWQVVPTILCELMNGDPVRSNRVMKALWGMEKLDIGKLQAAADGVDP